MICHASMNSHDILVQQRSNHRCNNGQFLRSVRGRVGKCVGVWGNPREVERGVGMCGGRCENCVGEWGR